MNTPRRYLAAELAALPQKFSEATFFLEPLKSTWAEKLLQRAGLGGMAERIRFVRSALRLFRVARNYDGIVTLGDLEGLTFAMLQRLRGKRRPVHVMYDCLWYGGNRLKRAWMRYCLMQVDCCVVWASIEIDRYASCYHLDPKKFLFVPHHHTAKRYKFDVADEGYVFTGGNWFRDYRLFVDAVRELNFPCMIVTTREKELFAGMKIPSHVQVRGATHEEFRQLMARSSIVVVPMQANLLHAGGQQTFLNAMLMGKPVILTDPQGGRDYIDDGVNGRLVPYGDKDQLANSIHELMSNPSVRAGMGEAAKKTALPLTTEACNIRIWEKLEELVDQHDLREKVYV